MKIVNLKCSGCKVEFTKPKKEYDRRIKLGKRQFFCSLSCGAVSNNKDKKIPPPEKKPCLGCGLFFQPRRFKKVITSFCSGSCASKNSVTDYRRLKASESGKNNQSNLLKTHETLKLREAWKYEKLKKVLDANKIEHEFEFGLGNYVFDLYIPKINLLIEFDAKYHNSDKQREIDQQKTNTAKKKGFKVARMRTGSNVEIPYKPVIKFIERFI
jgi:very-short-patch-repair endonuclease